jgi:hypothetical protein
VVKTQQEHELDQSPPSSAEVKNEWNCTSISPFVSVAQCAIKNVQYIICLKFFGAFSKLRIATISFVMSVCLSVLLTVRSSAPPPGTRQLSLNTLSRKLMFEYFSKIVAKIQVALKSGKNNGCTALATTSVYDNITLNSS